MPAVTDRSPFLEFGLNVDWKQFGVDAFAHRHNEIELIVVDGAPLTLVFGGTPHTLEVGRTAVFWAVTPHFALRGEPDAVLYWAKTPLDQFLQWDLPAPFSADVLNGRFVVDPLPRPVDISVHQFRSWRDYLAAGLPEERRIVLLEIEARLREIAVHRRVEGDVDRRPSSAALVGMDRMLAFIAGRYTEPITVPEIAAAAELQPGYAMRLFRSRFGMSMMECVRRHRVSHAQRLLLTTDASVLDILLESGFGSTAQFYAVFGAICGCTPLEYRRSIPR